MASKLTEREWKKVRARWESEEREGFHWIVRALELPVTAPGVRRRAERDGWKKNPVAITERAAAMAKEQALRSPDGRLSKSAKALLGEKPVQETETIEANNSVFTTGELAEKFGLTQKQALHALEFVTDFNPIQSALRAGYSEETARCKGSGMVSGSAFQQAVAYMMRERLERMGRDATELVRFHLAIIDFDPNEVCEHRIHACRYCWSKSTVGEPQHTMSSWRQEREKHEKRLRKLSESEQKAAEPFPDEPPSGWYEAKRGPNDECRECHGVGLSILKWKDSRYFSPMAKRLLGGVRVSKEGLEMVMLQKQASLAILSAHRGLTKAAEVQVNVGVVTDVARDYDQIMREARARQHAVLVERGLIEGSAGNG